MFNSTGFIADQPLIGADYVKRQAGQLTHPKSSEQHLRCDSCHLLAEQTGANPSKNEGHL